MEISDFYYRDDVSFFELFPATDTARQWANENLIIDPWQDNERIPIDRRMFWDIEETLKDFHFNVINMVASVENCHRLERYKFTEGVQMGLLCMHRVQGWIMAFRERESLQLTN